MTFDPNIKAEFVKIVDKYIQLPSTQVNFEHLHNELHHLFESNDLSTFRWTLTRNYDKTELRFNPHRTIDKLAFAAIMNCDFEQEVIVFPFAKE